MITNDEYIKIERNLKRLELKQEITAMEKDVTIKCLELAVPCLKCQYNDGNHHKECWDNCLMEEDAKNKLKIQSL